MALKLNRMLESFSIFSWTVFLSNNSQLQGFYIAAYSSDLNMQLKTLNI